MLEGRKRFSPFLRTRCIVDEPVGYSPAFVETLTKSRIDEKLMHALLSDRTAKATVPLLSNRIEFEVTAGMLKNRNKVIGGDGR